MKKKLTTLLFGLLLAVGWTSSAFAQSSPNNIPDAVHPKSYYDALTYTWTNAEGEHTSASTDLATDPYQIYELLRFVYCNPKFPGPRYAAYNYNGTVREDPVSYGPIQGGWNITAASDPRDIKINVSHSNSSYPLYIKSIQVKSGDKVLESWTYNSIVGRFFPTNWILSGGNITYSNNQGADYFNNTTSGTITIPAGLLGDYTNIQVVINARSSSTQSSRRCQININNTQQTTISTNSFTDFTWNLTLPTKTEIPFEQGKVQTPYEEGYTVLMVSVYDDATAATGSTIVTNGSYYNNKQGYIDYIQARIKSVQLLTNGMRVGNVDEHTSGTVFNCSGTYNKFYIIGKGQAREKSDYTKYNYSYTNNTWYAGEDVVHQQMFEQFSPTVTDKGADIKDFYTEMQDGHVYSVVHDCATVIQEGHQFSMSGNTGKTEYAMSGLNFFIPDYRLTYWNDPEFYFKDNDGNPIASSGPNSIDGRDINPYQSANSTGKTSSGLYYYSGGPWSAWWGNYNPDYAPKIGIYKITLEATAKKVAGYDAETNHKYDVTLNWASSLNEMSGEMVPQTYKIYIVSYDNEGNEIRTLLDTVEDETSYTYTVNQGDESYNITYIIEGTPTGDYPSFVAYSNVDDVVIPGLNDFLALKLDHYESDFVIGDNIGEEKNYYRNFLHVASDDEGEKALTVERINGGENEFKLYRYDAAKPLAEATLLPVGTLEFWDRHDNKRVGYGFSFETGENAQVVEPYTLKTNDNQTISNAYSHDKLGMPQNNNGFDLRIKGNGDIIIQPNGYEVNFFDISVYKNNTINNNNRVAHWQVSNGALENVGWILSPGSKWIQDPGTDYYYLEGGGYIAIPDMLNNYDNLIVVINASTDESTLGKISVNDHTKPVVDNTAKNYTWNVTDKYYKYVKVTDPNQLTSGQYLIVNEGQKIAFNSDLGVLDAASNYISVDIIYPESANPEIASSTLVDNAAFTIDMTAGTIYSTSGYYIGWTANSGNGLRQNATEAIANAISVDGNEAHIKTTTTTVRELRYNNASDQKRFRYYTEGSQNPIQLYKMVETTAPSTDHVVRLGSLPIIDQFAVNVADNKHPNRYGYILKYEPKQGATGEAAKPKSSSHVEVPVQKTGSIVNGYYTKDQVDNDKNRELTTDVLSSDMQITLSNTNSAAFYYSILSSNTEMPKVDKDSTYYVSNLQNDNFTYQEMWRKSSVVGARYPAGVHHFYDSIAVTGTYGTNYKTYVPFITSRAIERFYFVEDSLHNTYGSPIWAASVGKVDDESTSIAQKQNSQWAKWSADGKGYCIWLGEIDVNGLLPDANKTNIDYEPYMLRIWVQCDDLRNFHIGEHGYPIDDGAVEGGIKWLADVPFQSEVQNGKCNFKYGSISDEEGNGWSSDLNFGAPTAEGTSPKFIVRFYYRAKSATTAGLRAEGDEAPMYNAAESTLVAQIKTDVIEIRNNGEVVSKTYYNAQGMKSDKPFDGMNIVITRYSDGTTTTTKEVKL